MSYPSIGMPGIVPEDKWDAATLESMLRAGTTGNGIHIFFEDDVRGVAKFDDGLFQFEMWLENGDRKIVFKSASFLEFAVWCAFFGRDFL